MTVTSVNGSGVSRLLAEEAGLSRRTCVARTDDGANEPVTAEVYLRAFAVRAAIADALATGCQDEVREALEAGATWPQVAAARAVPIEQARAEFCCWVRRQAALWDSGPDRSGQRHGLDHQARRLAWALAHSDDQPIRMPSRLPKRVPGAALAALADNGRGSGVNAGRSGAGRASAR